MIKGWKNNPELVKQRKEIEQERRTNKLHWIQYQHFVESENKLQAELELEINKSRKFLGLI